MIRALSVHDDTVEHAPNAIGQGDWKRTVRAVRAVGVPCSDVLKMKAGEFSKPGRAFS